MTRAYDGVGPGFRRIDDSVPVKVGLEPDTSVGLSIFLPVDEDGLTRASTSVVFAFPGGTYSRHYFDMHIPGRTGYSMAEHLASRGHVVIACDYLGLGDSSPVEPFEAIGKDLVLSGMRATVASAIDRLSDLHGDLTTDGWPPPTTIGLGHSLGGYLVTLLQARWGVFGALGLLGYSPLRRNDPSNASRHEALMSRLTDPTDPRPHIDESFFYNQSVPYDVIAADRAQAVRLFAWALGGEGNMSVVDPEIPLATRSIDVPLLLAFGEMDMSPDPHLEPTAYPNSGDITLFVLRDAAHCFNLANTRELFYQRLATWIYALRLDRELSPRPPR